MLILRYGLLIHETRLPSIRVFPFGDASIGARNINFGSLGAFGRIAVIILPRLWWLKCLPPVDLYWSQLINSLWV
jgi:hypothetical protein